MQAPEFNYSSKHLLPVFLLALATYTNLPAQATTVPYEGTYRDVVIPENPSTPYLILTTVGGDGGKIQRENSYDGGRGAFVQAAFSIGTGQGQLAPGGTLRFIVGGSGDSEHDMSNADMVGAGGGGGTGIAYRTPAGKWTLLMVAGGGGGGNWKGLTTNYPGGPGKAYSKANIGDGGPSGFEGSGDMYNSGAGAFVSTPKSDHGMQSKAGWPGGPNSGEPTGGDAHDQGREYYYSGGWGFGAGGIGQRGDRETGGGGGYTGGESGGTCEENTCYRDGTNDHRFGKYDYMPSYGGISYVNETDMVVESIFTYERGHTSNPQGGYASYEYSNSGNVYNVMHLARKKNKCIDVPGGNAYSGANVQLWDCNNSPAQNWTFDGNMVKFGQNLNQCLELSGSTAKNGANIDTWGCNVGSNAQKWIYDGINKTIRSRVDLAYCIDLLAGIITNGNNIQLSDCENGNTNQQWIVDRATVPVISLNYNWIKLVGDPGKCVDVAAANTANGTNVQVYHCHSEDSQHWHFDGNVIHFDKDRNKCLDLSGGNTANGTNIQLWDCQGGNNNQVWIYDGVARSFRSIINPDKCIDVDHSNFNDHTNIQLWDCNGTTAQQFVIE